MSERCTDESSCGFCGPLDRCDTPPAPPAGLEQDKDLKSWLLTLGSAYENWHAADQRAGESEEWAAHRLQCKVRYEECESHLLAALAHARAEAKRETVEDIVKALREARFAYGESDKANTAFLSAADFIAQHFGRTE